MSPSIRKYATVKYGVLMCAPLQYE
uniref:Uncharacterized protein n=1 Tax=Anguilla anguilla TaxID=7936 RepID=A0A0E9TAY8_ANGAN